jgi:hypothetical protein
MVAAADRPAAGQLTPALGLVDKFTTRDFRLAGRRRLERPPNRKARRIELICSFWSVLSSRELRECVYMLRVQLNSSALPTKSEPDDHYDYDYDDNGENNNNNNRN